MFEAYPNLKQYFHEEAIGHAYVYNTLRDKLIFEKNGLETFTDPNYFRNNDLQKRLVANQLATVMLTQVECDEQILAYAHLTDVPPVCG